MARKPIDKDEEMDREEPEEENRDEEMDREEPDGGDEEDRDDSHDEPDEDEEDEGEGMDKSASGMDVTVIDDRFLRNLIRKEIVDALNKSLSPLVEGAVYASVQEGLDDMRAAARGAVKKAMSDVLEPRFEALEKSLGAVEEHSALVKGMCERLDEVGRSTPAPTGKPAAGNTSGEVIQKSTSTTTVTPDGGIEKSASGLTPDEVAAAPAVLRKAIDLKKAGHEGISATSQDLMQAQSGRLTPERYRQIAREINSASQE